MAKCGGGAKTPSFGCFFISSTEWVEKTNFGQLTITMSNETGNSLWCNYIVNGLNWVSLAFCHLNLFLIIIICIDA